MAKVKIKGVENVTKRIKENFEKIRKDPQLLAEIAVVMQEEMLGQARSGVQASQKGKSKFPSLSDSWIVTREYLSKFNARDGQYFAGGKTSNLTFTGALLSHGTKKRIEASSGTAIVEANSGNHPGYKTAHGHTKGPSYANLIKWQAASGRRFLVVSDRLISRINVLTKRFVRKLIVTKGI